MATLTKSYSENAGSSSNRYTWTFTFTGTNITASGSTFTPAMPTVKARHIGSGRGYGHCGKDTRGEDRQERPSPGGYPHPESHCYKGHGRAT